MHCMLRYIVMGALGIGIGLQAGCGGDDDDRYPCGEGSCLQGTEVCIIGGPDSCSTCVAAPEAFLSNPSCESLPPANDSTYGEFQCLDQGFCTNVENGAILTCSEIEWGCS